MGSFLDNIKVPGVQSTAPETKPNPLLKANPFVKKPAETAEKKVDLLAKLKEEPAKVDPFAAKEEGKPAEEVKEPVQEEAPAQEVVPVQEEPVVAETEAEEEEGESEEEDKAQDTQPGQTQKKKRHRRTRAEMEAARKAEAEKKAKAEDQETPKTEITETVGEPDPAEPELKVKAERILVENVPIVEVNKPEEGYEYFKYPRTEMTFEEALEHIKPSFVDEDWDQFRARVVQELNDIEIDDAMDPAILKITIARLSHLRQEIWETHQDMKTQYDNLSFKEPEGIIEQVKKLNLGNGKNDLERKKAGIEAAMNHEGVNLFELLSEIRKRWNFLKAAMDSIEYKTRVLITMNGALKLELEHTQ